MCKLYLRHKKQEKVRKRKEKNINNLQPSKINLLVVITTKMARERRCKLPSKINRVSKTSITPGMALKISEMGERIILNS